MSSLQLSVPTSDGWRHAFTYQWIENSINRNLVCTYVRMYVRMHACIYKSFSSDTRGFGVVSCMNLLSIVYQNTISWQTVKCMIRKNENVKLDFYMWGLNFTMLCL